ncbi:DUF7742 family protein [Anianabacter salinae]|uniref:DUF7742 family protein n=1 Tax=Anianabacter salinae TaxID=2851023 RepID=UPI00225E58C0|nr:hypothetical protein [Anianabacter salinae]
MHGDVVAAARVLKGVPGSLRAALLVRLLRQTEAADRFRRAQGRLHPLWGDGSLMAAALARRPGPEPHLDDADYCDCLALVFTALARRGGIAIGNPPGL